MGEEFKPQLLDLIPKERDWMGIGGSGGRRNGLGVEEEKRLELRLGPPGSEDEDIKKKTKEASIIPLGYFNSSAGARRFMEKEELENGKGEQQRRLERKAGFHISSQVSATVAAVNANSSQTRADTVPTVGWPPVRSFRKNLASTSKPSAERQNRAPESAAKLENSSKSLLVKINMDGIPIGRKVDLKVNNSYEKLSFAVDKLFRGLISAQRDPLASGTLKNLEEKQMFTGLLDGSGDYTLVYEDNEGDRMLVGDVPWDMFVSNAKRLRVLKTSDLSALSLGSVSRKRTAHECCIR